jgi:signal recognition particle subunit SRP68
LGRSYAVLSKSKEALALFSQASNLADSATPQASADAEGAPKLDVSPVQSNTLQSTLRQLVAQYRGLVTLEQATAEEASQSSQRPVVERLQQFAGSAVNLNNLVPYPPQMQPIPVKPLFLDVAWNYIDYPREGQRQEAPAQAQAQGQAAVEEETKGKRGWFGFGGR